MDVEKMNGPLPRFLALFAATLTVLPGCAFWRKDNTLHNGVQSQHYDDELLQIDFPQGDTPSDLEAAMTPQPMTLVSLTETPPQDYWELPLSEVVQMAMANSKVIRDLDGLVLRSPENKQTIFDPSIRETDPRVGVEAALSEFDASFSTSAFWENNDRALNNQFFGGGTRVLLQDLGVYQTQITKRAVTGTELTIRNNVQYDNNNAPGNQFRSAWDANVEAEFRHPLLRGGGIDFNRIAGTSNVPGVYTGVLIARMNTDIDLAGFEMAVIDFVSNVENAYWDLYFAYRDLDSKISARNDALDTWRYVQSNLEAGIEGAGKEAQAREQYFRFQENVQNALHGKLQQSTQTNNGNPGGSFRGVPGVLVAERRLRLLMGLSISDGRVIRPADDPLQARVTFNWDEILMETLSRRAELRRQKWDIKQKELALEASHNFLLPSLDAIGQYRWRGFGKDLLRQHEQNQGNPLFNNAYGNLTNGDFQEWQLGFELSFPFGRRRAHAAVRNAELELARSRALLNEQEHQVVYDLSNAVADVERAYSVLETSFNRRLAAEKQVKLVKTTFEDTGQPTLDVVLEAQRRLAEAETGFYQALVEYSLAVKNVHYAKGSLLDYNEVFLAEGCWPNKAYHDAAERASLQKEPWKVIRNFVSGPKPVVSDGMFPQILAAPGEGNGNVVPAPADPEPAYDEGEASPDEN